jgi:hypothetical protein
MPIEVFVPNGQPYHVVLYVPNSSIIIPFNPHLTITNAPALEYEYQTADAHHNAILRPEKSVIIPLDTPSSERRQQPPTVFNQEPKLQVKEGSTIKVSFLKDPRGGGSVMPSVHYKYFTRKLIQVYFAKSGLATMKRVCEPYYEELLKQSIRKKPTIAKLARCWGEVPKFREEFSYFVLHKIEEEDIIASSFHQQPQKTASALLTKECYGYILQSLKKALKYLFEKNLTHQYEIVHMWPNVEFRKRRSNGVYWTQSFSMNSLK